MGLRKGVALLAVGALAAVAAQVTSAATITVNTTADNLTGGDGQCTLREALANVNAAADTTSGDCTAGTGAGDTVIFNLTLPSRSRSAKIKLTLGELDIQHDVAVTGPTAVALHVSGERASRILNISAGTTVNVSDLAMEKGLIVAPHVPVWGGAILNMGTLSLANCTLTNNKSFYLGDAYGGAIFNMGTMTLTNCTLANNKSLDGGAVQNGGTMTLIDCTLKNNGAMVGGGGIENSGTMTLTNCTLAGNYAFSGPVGSHGAGGIANNGHGTMTLTNCTLNGNRASEGGGIGNGSAATMTLTNCTLTGNYAWRVDGGAISNLGRMTLTNCTVSGNRAYAGPTSLHGAGIWSYPADEDPDGVGGTATVTNTIISGNGKGWDCGGNRPISNGHNLDSDGTCFTGGGTDLVHTDPLLAPLANYGGPTKTLALCSGAGVPRRSCSGASSAIDAGDDAVTGSPLNLTTDQRGLPRLFGAHVDIGAYEVQQ